MISTTYFDIQKLISKGLMEVGGLESNQKYLKNHHFDVSGTVYNVIQINFTIE